MKEAVNAYRKVSASDEYKERERMRSKSKHNEASALYHAEQVGINKGIEVGREKERAIWEKERAIWEKERADREKKIAEMLDEKDAEIARLSNKNTE